VEVFSKVKTKTLPLDRPTDHVIHMEPGYKLSYRQIYSLTELELMTIKNFIERNLASSLIQLLSSPAAAQILFAMK